MKEDEDILAQENTLNLKHSLSQSNAFQKILFETKSSRYFYERKRKEEVNSFIP